MQLGVLVDPSDATVDSTFLHPKRIPSGYSTLNRIKVDVP